MSRFDWQTDEDDWDDLPPPTESRPLALWKRLVIILVVFIFVGSSALVALRQIDFRSQKTVTEATADVQSAHDLWRQAVSAGDVQLVAGLLDQERYPLWAEAQLQRIGTGLPLFEREAYGFRLADSHWQENFAAADQINLASTLNHAEVTFTQTYQVLTPAALTETISLEHTLAYHYRDGQWLAGPLANTSWGATRTYRLPHLTLTFPERDSDIMQRLILDWGQLSQQLCAAAPPFRCARTYTLGVEMSSAPNAMYTSLTGVTFTVVPGQRLHAFSTPTYLGRPTEEAGYQALCRAYSHALARQILLDIQQTSSQAEVNGPVWMETRLHELGLAPAPTLQPVFPGNAVPMPRDRLTPICLPNAGQIAAVGG